MRLNPSLILSFILAASSAWAADPFKIWTSTDGKSIHAALIGRDEKNALFLLKNYTIAKVPYTRLAETFAEDAKLSPIDNLTPFTGMTFEEIKTTDGEIYTKVKILAKLDDRIYFRYGSAKFKVKLSDSEMFSVTRLPYEVLSKKDQERLGGFDAAKAEIARAKWLGEIDSDGCHPVEKMSDFYDPRFENGYCKYSCSPWALDPFLVDDYPEKLLDKNKKSKPIFRPKPLKH